MQVNDSVLNKRNYSDITITCGGSHLPISEIPEKYMPSLFKLLKILAKTGNRAAQDMISNRNINWLIHNHEVVGADIHVLRSIRRVMFHGKK